MLNDLDTVSNMPILQQNDVQTLYTEGDLLEDLWTKKLHGMSLRRIASCYPDIITYGDIARCLKGNIPKTVAKRNALGLRLGQITTIVIMTYGEIPEGTQSITAVRCSCGRFYISNHPARKKCFICSPYRKGVNSPKTN